MIKKIIIDKDELINKYVNEELSKPEVAKYFGCSVDTITARMREYNIPARNAGAKPNKRIILSDIQQEALVGCLLGDGCLYQGKIGNAQLSYLSKSKQHVEFVAQYFKNFITSEGIKYNEIYDKRTDKTYSNYRFRTMLNITFSEIRQKWYSNGSKIIPANIILTPLTCLIWYIGDGGLVTTSRSQYLKLSTHNFSLEELKNILLPQLQDFEASCMSAGKENQYFIYIPRRKISKFLNYIGNCPFEDYKHKWNFLEYKYSIYETKVGEKHDEI